MDNNILNTEEKSYLLRKAELHKTSRQISEVVKQMKEDFINLSGGNESIPMVTYGIPGQELDLKIKLDRLTPEKFEIILPYFRRNLAKYHELRDTQKDLEKTLQQEKTPDFFDVVEKKRE